jgi:uncharacterized membrane protein (TIGR02234 family)
MRREFALVLLVGAAGAGVVLLALRQAWAVAVFTQPRPLPAQDISVTGQQLVPLAGALALAALACLAAVIATRSAVRRVAGGLLAILGVGAGIAAVAAVRASGVLAAARASAAADALGGSTTSGSTPGGPVHAIIIAGSGGHVVMSGVPWHVVAACGAAAIVLAGLATAWRGPRWPVMSARFERTGAAAGRAGAADGRAGAPDGRAAPAQAPAAPDSATMWESLSRDLDPTDPTQIDGRTRG